MYKNCGTSTKVYHMHSGNNKEKKERKGQKNIRNNND